MFSLYAIVILFLTEVDANGYCRFFDRGGLYTCELGAKLESNKILVINGTHLPGRTNADVLVLETTTLSSIPIMDATIMNTFRNLRLLNLASTNIERVAFNAFPFCDNLVELNLFQNRLLALEIDFLLNCRNLRSINLNNNQILGLTASVLRGLENLEHFTCNFNPNLLIVGNIFDTMISLRQVSLARNDFLFLPPGLFNNQQNLTNIDISGNRLTDFTIIRNALGNVNIIERLDLRNNGIEHLDSEFLRNMTSLREIWLSGNPVGFIPPNTFPPSLVFLILSLMNLSALDANMFQGLANLQNLILSDNPSIVELPKNIFAPLINLQTLELSNCGLIRLDAETFQHNVNLGRLWLNSNEIEELNEGTFASLINLSSSINLNFNKITRLNSDSFGHHPHLTDIFIVANQLDEIEPGFFRSFPSLWQFSSANNICIDITLWLGINTDGFDSDGAFIECHQNWETPRTTTEPPPENDNDDFLFNIIVFGSIGLLVLLIIVLIVVIIILRRQSKRYDVNAINPENTRERNF